MYLTGEKDFEYPTGVPLPWETHGGEDVAIYAQGPMSHLFHGTQVRDNRIGGLLFTYLRTYPPEKGHYSVI